MTLNAEEPQKKRPRRFYTFPLLFIKNQKSSILVLRLNDVISEQGLTIAEFQIFSQELFISRGRRTAKFLVSMFLCIFIALRERIPKISVIKEISDRRELLSIPVLQMNKGGFDK